MNKVHTYYEPVKEINNSADKPYLQNELIEICRQSWLINGWDLVIISHKDAKKHPLYKQYNSVIKTFPSINPGKYDYHCYIRWLAMAQVGGGLMIDYDVMNYQFLSSGCLETFNLYSDKITIYQHHVPCVVYGTQEQYIDICKEFMSLDSDNFLDKNQPVKHTSDMIMLSKPHFDGKINKVLSVTDYPKIAPLIHCSQRSCSDNLKTKPEAMRDILNKIKK